MAGKAKKKVCFSGCKYEVRVLNEGTPNEKLVISKKGKEWKWKKPLVLGS